MRKKNLEIPHLYYSYEVSGDLTSIRINDLTSNLEALGGKMR